LIEWGLNDFENKTVLKTATIIANAPVAMGQTKEVGLVIKKDVKITISKAPKKNYKIEINYKTPLVAPLNAGDEVGTARIIIPNMPPIEHTLYVAEDVYKLGFFKATFEKAKRFIVGQL
jgi:D-alanyl-D-alanine carboxypeptidase (penicillin-binding protein 5/6)